MSFYRKFDMDTLASRASPASPESSNSKLAGIAGGLSPETRALAMLADACDRLSLAADDLGTALDDEDRANLHAGELSAETLRAFALAVVQRRQREAGEVPEAYTQQGRCAECGPVYLPPGWSRLADSCPWCFNRQAGRPFPRPEPVRCADCRHFQPDTIGDGGGVGSCGAGRDVPVAERPLYPRVERECQMFHAVPSPQQRGAQGPSSMGGGGL